jgi:hypothetical protein
VDGSYSERKRVSASWNSGGLLGGEVVAGHLDVTAVRRSIRERPPGPIGKLVGTTQHQGRHVDRGSAGVVFIHESRASSSAFGSPSGDCRPSRRGGAGEHPDHGAPAEQMPD